MAGPATTLLGKCMFPVSFHPSLDTHSWLLWKGALKQVAFWSIWLFLSSYYPLFQMWLAATVQECSVKRWGEQCNYPYWKSRSVSSIRLTQWIPCRFLQGLPATLDGFALRLTVWNRNTFFCRTLFYIIRVYVCLLWFSFFLCLFVFITIILGASLPLKFWDCYSLGLNSNAASRLEHCNSTSVPTKYCRHRVKIKNDS